MCGILGSVNLSFDEKLLNTLSHRGPDDFGIEKFRLSENWVYLGQRRLSIVDLSEAGHQPMVSSCGNFAIIFNGEIYNHLELRKRIEHTSYRGHSDTETILYYIAQFGIDGIKDLNGIFAFAFIDIKNNKLILARDRFGVKPLYYKIIGDKLIFASEIRPINKVAGDSIDLDNLSVLLRLRYNPSPDTLYKHIKKLTPGHYVELNVGSLSEFQEKTFYKPKFAKVNIRFDEAVEEYKLLLSKAVKRQLMSDVEVGVLLSGGIDSALIALNMKYQTDTPFKAFTVGFEGQHYSDEISDASIIANFIGIKHQSYRVGIDDYSNTLSKIFEIVEEPCGIMSIIPFYFLCRMVKENNIKVVLTGQGADEPWGGYTKYQGELLQKYLPEWINKIPYLQHLTLVQKNELLKRAIYALPLKDKLERFERIVSIFSEEEISKLTGKYSNKSIGYFKNTLELIDGNKIDSVEALMACDIRMDLSDDLLNYTDKISMHFGIEARVPYLDNELIEFVESLPVEFKLKLGKGKILHKKLAESFFPKPIVHKKKKGFLTPFESWIKDEGVQYLRELLISKDSKFSNYFDVKAVEQLFVEHLKLGINRDKQIFTLLSIYFWIQNLEK